MLRSLTLLLLILSPALAQAGAGSVGDSVVISSGVRTVGITGGQLLVSDSALNATAATISTTVTAIKARADLLATEVTLVQIATNTAAIASDTAGLTFDNNGFLKVVQPPPTAPTGTTALGFPAYPDDQYTIGPNATVDVSTVIPNGETWTVQRLKSGAADGGTGKNIIVQLFYDPVPPLGAGVERLDAVFLNADNAERVIDRTFTGDGTRRILMRTTQQGAASMAVYTKWTGFKQ